MSRRSQALFMVGALAFALLLAACGWIPLVSPVIVGGALLALTIVLLVWHVLALAAYKRQGKDVVVFSRGPWLLIVGLLLIEALCVLDILVAPPGDTRIWLFIGYFLFGLIYAAFLPNVLLSWVADDTALTSQVLTFKRSLPWHEIDWMYLESNETTQKKYSITLARWRDEQLRVEAGSRRAMSVLVRSPLSGGAPSPLLQAIRARATNALVGIDQLPAVQARRRGQSPALSTQPEPKVTLAEAVALARGASLPPTWTRFSVRQSVIWPNLLVSFVLALFAVGFGVYVAVSGTAFGLDVIPDALLVGPQRPLIVIGEAIVFVGIGVYIFVAMTLRWVRTLQRPQDYFFLVTPRYVAEVKGQKVDGVALSNVRGISRSGGGTYGWQIALTLRNGSTKQFDVGANYGPARDLFAYVLAAHNAQQPGQPGQATSLFGPALQTEVEQ